MIDVRKIGPTESVSVDGIWEVSIPKSFGVAPLANVEVTGRLTNGGRAFVLKAEAFCEIGAACSRCLAPVVCGLGFLINEDFVEAGAARGEEIAFYDKSIDIKPAIERNLFLRIPIKPLCDKDCAGLCPRCGANLNHSACDCGQEINEQFRELLLLFNKEV